MYAIDEQLQRLEAREEGAMEVLKGIQVCSTPLAFISACFHDMCAPAPCSHGHSRCLQSQAAALGQLQADGFQHTLVAGSWLCSLQAPSSRPAIS